MVYLRTIKVYGQLRPRAETTDETQREAARSAGQGYASERAGFGAAHDPHNRQLTERARKIKSIKNPFPHLLSPLAISEEEKDEFIYIRVDSNNVEASRL